MRKNRRSIPVAAGTCMAALLAFQMCLTAPGAELEEKTEKEAAAFTLLPDQVPTQKYQGGQYQVDVYGSFTQLKGADGTTSVVEDSRLLMKRGSMIAVPADMSYLNGRVDQVLVDSISGSEGETQYLSVLEDNYRIEDYYEELKWPDKLSNSGIKEISRTLDTSDTVLMVRYTDNTVAAFNYVTGNLLFKDETEKKSLSFGEYVGNWFTEKWNNLFGPSTLDYDEIKFLEKQLEGKPVDAELSGILAGNGDSLLSGDKVVYNPNGQMITDGVKAEGQIISDASALENHMNTSGIAPAGTASKEASSAGGTAAPSQNNQIYAAGTYRGQPEGIPVSDGQGAQEGKFFGTEQSGQDLSNGLTNSTPQDNANRGEGQNNSNESASEGTKPGNEAGDAAAIPGQDVLGSEAEASGDPAGEGIGTEDSGSAINGEATSTDGMPLLPDPEGMMEQTADSAYGKADAQISEGMSDEDLDDLNEDSDEEDIRENQDEDQNGPGNENQENSMAQKTGNAIADSESGEEGESGSPSDETEQEEQQASVLTSDTESDAAEENLAEADLGQFLTVYNPDTEEYELYNMEEYLAQRGVKGNILNISGKFKEMNGAGKATGRLFKEMPGWIGYVAALMGIIMAALVFLRIAIDKKLKV